MVNHIAAVHLIELFQKVKAVVPYEKSHAGTNQSRVAEIRFMIRNMLMPVKQKQRPADPRKTKLDLEGHLGRCVNTVHIALP